MHTSLTFLCNDYKQIFLFHNLPKVVVTRVQTHGTEHALKINVTSNNPAMANLTDGLSYWLVLRRVGNARLPIGQICLDSGLVQEWVWPDGHKTNKQETIDQHGTNAHSVLEI